MLLSYFARVNLLCWLLPLCAAWTHTVVRKQRLGCARALAAVPALVILALAPLLFDHETEPVALMSTAYLSERLPLTKLLAFCLGRGPLAEHQHQLTLHQFTALMLCPCVIRRENTGSKHLTPATPRNLLTALSLKCLAISLLVMLPRYLSSRAVQHLAAAIGMYCATSGTLDFFMLMCHNLGLDLAMTFKQPFLSASLSEFWGIRWNVPQAHLLRSLVYAPIVEGRLIKLPPQQQQQQQEQEGGTLAATGAAQSSKQGGGREQAGLVRERERPRIGGSNRVRAVAVMATFLFSGLEHLVFIWFITRKLHWPWMTFFAVHGVLIIVLEHLLPNAFWSSLLRPVRVVLTMALLHATGCLWFYEPFLDPVLLGRVARSFRETQAYFASYFPS